MLNRSRPESGETSPNIRPPTDFATFRPAPERTGAEATSNENGNYVTVIFIFISLYIFIP